MAMKSDLVIHDAELGILLFLILSIGGLILLALLKTFIDRYFARLDREKSRWRKLIDRAVETRTMELDPSPKTRRELIGFAMAMAEFTASTPAEYHHFCRLIRYLRIDERLADAYRHALLGYRRAFYLSLLSDLPCSHQRPLYLKIIEEEEDHRFYSLAIYALSKTVGAPDDARKFLEILAETGPRHHLGRNYCELLIFVAFRHLESEELDQTIDRLLSAPTEHHLLRCVTEALGRFRRPEMGPLLLRIHRARPEDGELLAAVIRSLFLSRARSCDLVREALRRGEIPVRITCAKFGLDLCPTSREVLAELLRYFFDENHYVRQNIYRACRRHRITKETILSLVEQYFPEKASDRFFREMMETYDTEEGAAT